MGETVGQDADGLKRGAAGAVAAGHTTRFYALNFANKLGRIAIPTGACFFGIMRATAATRVEVKAGAKDLASAAAFAVGNSTKLDADTLLAAFPVVSGEVIHIRHEDDATNIGDVWVVLEGRNLPSSLTTATG